MKQPALGVAASTLIVAISLVVVRLLGPDLFMGWASYALMCAIPFSVVVGVFWKGTEPAAIAGLGQPSRGIAYVALAAVVAAVVSLVHWQLRGGGLNPPVPMAVMTIITSVCTTFFLAIPLGGWPFSLIKNKLAAGVALLVGCYVVNALIFQLMNFGFAKGAPWYSAALDPQGPLDAWTVVVGMVTSLAVMYVFILADVWPLTRSAALRANPLALGVVWILVCFAIGSALFYLGTSVAGMEAPVFMVRVPIPFLFGSILVFNMLGNSLFGSLAQPVKGLVAAVAAAVIGNVMALLYAALMPVLSGPMVSGPSGNFAAELWLANSLLAVTFPFLAMYGDFFGLWPLSGRVRETVDAAAS